MISNYLTSIEEDLKQNEPDRHNELVEKLADWISGKVASGARPKVNFICTHNSRRSQFSQTWFDAVQQYLEVDFADSYSGGTEVTACNERTIAALKRAGFTAESEGDENPVYSLKAKENGKEIRLWSKVFDGDSNPSGTFAAVMTCDHADQNCPFIPGADIRIPLTYTDPKYADGTAEEESAYDKTCRIIATDMMRIVKAVRARVQESANQ